MSIDHRPHVPHHPRPNPARRFEDLTDPDWHCSKIEALVTELNLHDFDLSFTRSVHSAWEATGYCSAKQLAALARILRMLEGRAARADRKIRRIDPATTPGLGDELYEPGRALFGRPREDNEHEHYPTFV